MDAPDSLGEGVLVPGNRDQMDVIGHQAIAEYFQAVFVGLLLQQQQIDAPVGIDKEHILAVVPPLGHMMGQARNGNSGDPGHHSSTVPLASPSVKQKIGDCPLFSGVT